MVEEAAGGAGNPPDGHERVIMNDEDGHERAMAGGRLRARPWTFVEVMDGADDSLRSAQHT